MDTFKKQLDYEIKCQLFADKVYNNLFSAKIKRYDGNHILLEPLTIEDLNKLSTLE